MVGATIGIVQMLHSAFISYGGPSSRATSAHRVFVTPDTSSSLEVLTVLPERCRSSLQLVGSSAMPPLVNKEANEFYLIYGF